MRPSSPLSGPAVDLPDAARWLAVTPLLDHTHPRLQQLMTERGWLALPLFERVGAVYDFVRNEVAFGYNSADDLPASAVLADGLGQCNTKGTLLMALLRGVGLPCRFHGFTIAKPLQRGAVTGWAYLLAPRSIIHSWVELWWQGRWLALEGFILDQAYLGALQRRFVNHRGPFCGYGAAVPDLQNPPVVWCGQDTYIQRDGINHDFGVYDDPDAFYAQHGVNLSGLRRWVFQHLVRHRMNRRVASLRAGGT